ncbi:DUF6801 domain-containing protein [Actinokineospora iranica]|uniref:DUF6801 domain-containing protein n=1 Tax=Actinokineospora iranica TaxID=1271860 RepID=A0A1G6XQG8_9PSEU|nr:DUF6801 domain-containing protein [Actinokineospora iranica]SDD79617.1 hypothetical protein SAMN05216174_11840 [Actinokineospora iranica]
MRLTKARRAFAGFLAMLSTASVLAVASAATAEATTVSHSKSTSCKLSADGGEYISASVSISVDFPDLIYAGVPTRPSPFTATAFPRDFVQEFRRVGATTMDATASVQLALDGGLGPDSRASATWSATDLPLDSPESGNWSGTGFVRPITMAAPGKQIAVHYVAFGVTFTPRKADGSLTSLGVVRPGCIHVPYFEPWHMIDVLPRVEHADLAVSGSTRLARPDVEAATGPGTLSADLDHADDSVTGTLRLDEPIQANVAFLGVLPATATVHLTQTGPLKGETRDGTLRAEAPLVVKVTDLAVLGVPVIRADADCQTAPTALALTSGPAFTLAEGGPLSGGYTIPAFTGCGPHTGFLNSLLSGPGNTLSLTAARA